MYQKPTVPRSIGGVLDDTLQLYKASFSRCFVPAVLVAIAAALLAWRQVDALPLSASGNMNLQAMLTRGMTTTPMSGLFSLLAMLLDLLFYGIMIYIIAAVSRGETPSLGESFSASLRRLPENIAAAILLFILAVLGFLVAFVPPIVLLATRGAGGSSAQVLGRLAPAIPVTLLLLIPVLYLLSRLSLYMVPLVTESQGPMRSLATSWRLVGGNWWRASTVVFVMGIILYLLTIVVVAIGGAIGAVTVGIPRGAGQVLGAATIVGVIVGSLARIISAPLMAAMLVSIYQDLLLRKGGGDLEARLGALPKG